MKTSLLRYALVSLLSAAMITLVFVNVPFEKQTTLASPILESVNPDCTDNYDTWNNSTTYNENYPWSLDFISSGNFPANPKRIEQFIDLNGDGLLDYMMFEGMKYNSFENPQHYNALTSCVYLNNGSGWEKASQCHIRYDNAIQQILYYGDCAG